MTEQNQHDDHNNDDQQPTEPDILDMPDDEGGLTPTGGVQHCVTILGHLEDELSFQADVLIKLANLEESIASAIENL